MNTLRERMPPRAACAVARAGPAVRSAAASPEANRLKSALGEVFLALLGCVSALAAFAEPHARGGVLALAGTFRQREAGAKGIEVTVLKIARTAWGCVEKVADMAKTKGAAYEGTGKEVVACATGKFAQGVEWINDAADAEKAEVKVVNGEAKKDLPAVSETDASKVAASAGDVKED